MPPPALSQTERATLLATLLFSLIALEPLALGTGPDESLYVQTAMELQRSTDPWLATSEGQAHWHKPPLLYWLTEGAISLFGETAFAIRLTPALFGWLSAVALFLVARRLFSAERALVVPWATVSCLGLLKFARLTMMDTGLLFAFAWQSWALVRAVQLRQVRQLTWLAGPVALVLWLKGPGLLLVLGFTLVGMLWQLERSWLRAPWLWLGLLLGVVIGSPWFLVWLVRDGSQFIDKFFIAENVGKLTVPWSISTPLKPLVTVGVYALPLAPLAFAADVGPRARSERVALWWLVSALVPFMVMATSRLQWSLPAMGGVMLLLAAPPVRRWPAQVMAVVFALVAMAFMVGTLALSSGDRWLAVLAALACGVAAHRVWHERRAAAAMAWAVAVVLTWLGPAMTYAGTLVPSDTVARVREREVLVLSEHPGLFSLSFHRPLHSVRAAEVEEKLRAGSAIIGFARDLPCDLPGVTCDRWWRMSMYPTNDDGRRAWAERSLRPLQMEWACATVGAH